MRVLSEYYNRLKLLVHIDSFAFLIKWHWNRRLYTENDSSEGENRVWVTLTSC